MPDSPEMNENKSIGVSRVGGRKPRAHNANREPLPRLSVRTFRKDVTEYLRAAILSGDFPPGSPLVERLISEETGVSRAPIREAMQRLEDEGLVVTIPYTGTYVAEVGNEQIEYMQELRYVLDLFAAEHALPKIDDEAIQKLNESLSEMSGMIENKQFNQFHEAHSAFHRVIYELAGNPLLLNFWHMMERLYQLHSQSKPMNYIKMNEMVPAHQRYIDVFVSKDPARIREEVIDHVRRYAGPNLTQ